MLNIVITTYNKAGYIEQLLDSLYNQTNNENIAVYCVDDNSTDQTKEIIKNHLISKRDNFSLIENDSNKWVSYGRNIGIAKSNQEDWLTYIDGDDWVAPNYIETLLSYIKDTSNDVYVFDYNIDPVDGSDPDEIEKVGHPSCWQMIYKVSFLKDNKIAFKDKYKIQGFGEDEDFFNQIQDCNAKISYTNDIIYNYHWGIPDSLSNIHIEL